MVFFIPALTSGDRAIWIETPNMAKAILQHQELISNFRLLMLQYCSSNSSICNYTFPAGIHLYRGEANGAPEVQTTKQYGCLYSVYLFIHATVSVERT